MRKVDKDKPRGFLRTVEDSMPGDAHEDPSFTVANLFRLLHGSWAESGQTRIVRREWRHAYRLMVALPDKYRAAYVAHESYCVIASFAGNHYLKQAFGGAGPGSWLPDQRLRPVGGTPLRLAQLVNQEGLRIEFIVVPRPLIGMVSPHAFKVEARVYINGD